MRINSLWLVVVAALGLALAGCAGSQVRHQTDAKLNSQNVQAKKYLQSATSSSGKKDGPVVTDTPWVSVKPVTTKTKLPPIFHKRAALSEPYPTQVQTVLDKLRQVTDLHITLQRDVIERPALQDVLAQQASTMTSTTDSTGAAASLANQQQNLGETQVTGASLPKVKITVSHTGTVQSLLDAVAAALQCDWRYEADQHRIVFYRYVTRYYHLVGFPGTDSTNNTVTTGSTSDGGSTSSVTYGGNQLSKWKNLKDGLKSLLSADGRYIVDETSGTVLVRDLPDIMKRVSHYIGDLNSSAKQQIAIDVRVYRVSVDSSDTRGINWGLLFESSGFKATLTSPRGNLTNVSSLVLASPDSATGNWNGSQLFLDSLSKLGKVSVVSTTTLRTVNHQAVPFNSTRTIAYVKSTQVQSTANVGTTTTQQTDSVDVGFNVNVMPDIQPNSRDVLMQVGMSLSALDDLKTISNNGSTVQLPEVSRRNFLQRIWLRSGQSLVVAGYQQVNTSLTKSGVITYDSWGAGGRADAANTTDTLVIVLTPHVRRIGNDFASN